MFAGKQDTIGVRQLAKIRGTIATSHLKGNKFQSRKLA
jgi:hypothetical protein